MILFIYVNFIMTLADKMVFFTFERVGHPDIFHSFSFIHFICHVYNILQSCMINRKEKIKWRGDLKETTGLILGQVSSLKKRNRS